MFMLILISSKWLILKLIMKKYIILNILCALMSFSRSPAQETVVLESSDIPVIIIHTPDNQSIPKEPKISAVMEIIDNGAGQRNYLTDVPNIYSGEIGIEIRGRYSASLPQKPYGFETRDGSGMNLNTPLLSLPPENDWILLACYNDKTFLRNYLAFEIFRQMGHYSPRSEFCEVVLNNQYQGIYLLTEKIKIDKNRVDIARLNPSENSGDDLTGGYIIKNDYFTANDSWLSDHSPIGKPDSKVYFVFHDPDAYELTSTQKDYIKSYIDEFEDILYGNKFADPLKGYRSYINTGSFTDYFIISEVTRNVDAYKKSRYLYKEKDSDGGLLYSGPLWDFDWAWRNLKENCVHFNKTDGSGWAYKINECYAYPVPPSWEVRLLQDKFFLNEIHDRYFTLRKGILALDHIYEIIDSVALLIDEAQQRHFARWPILGINTGTPESGEQPSSYQGEILKFKDWISTRLKWLDDNMVGKSLRDVNSQNAIVRIFPNPAADRLCIASDTIISVVSIYDINGVTLVQNSNFGNYSADVDISGLPAGFYIARIQFAHGETIMRRFIKR